MAPAMFAPFEKPAAISEPGVKPYFGRRARRERRQLRRGARDIRVIEHAFREAAEETRRAALEHVTARAQQRGAGCDHPAEREEIGLVAAGAVQQEERGRARHGRGLEAMDVAELRCAHG